MTIKIDFSDASLNKKWLELFGPHGLDITCITEHDLKQQNDQPSLGSVNWGGATFEHPWASVGFDRDTQFYLARLAIDIKTIKPTTGDFCSVVGCSTNEDNFKTAISDLHDKLLKRLRNSDLVYIAGDLNNLTDNSECTPEYLESKDYIAVSPRKMFLF